MSQTATHAVAETDAQKLENDPRVSDTDIEINETGAAVIAHPTDDIARTSLKEDLQQTDYDGYVSFIKVA